MILLMLYYSLFLSLLPQVPQSTSTMTKDVNQDTDTTETLHTDVHLSNIDNSQAMETTQMPYNWWLNQENVVHNGVFLSHKE
jgi:hypothetical protein